jgi:Holliday junction resolvase RusA-like endonuclease
VIVLPWPSSALSSNARGHWAKKARATAKYRDDARLCTLAAKPCIPAEGEIAVTVRFVPPHNRGDRANYPAMLKAGLDGVADALKVNDRRFSPHFTYADPEKPGRVELTFGGQP